MVIFPSQWGGGKIENIIDIIFPIGIIVEFDKNIDPNSLYPNTKWERYGDGQFLIGYKEESAYSELGATGGEETHKLTTREIPSHYHTQEIRGQVNTSFTNGSGGLYHQGGLGVASTYGTGRFSSTVGNDEAHNNMPPYIVVSRWHRIS